MRWKFRYPCFSAKFSIFRRCFLINESVLCIRSHVEPGSKPLPLSNMTHPDQGASVGIWDIFRIKTYVYIEILNVLSNDVFCC